MQKRLEKLEVQWQQLPPGGQQRRNQGQPQGRKHQEGTEPGKEHSGSVRGRRSSSSLRATSPQPLPPLEMEPSKPALGGEFLTEATLRPRGDGMGPEAAETTDKAAAGHRKTAGGGSDFWLPSLRRRRQWSPPATPRLRVTGSASPSEQGSLRFLPSSAAGSWQSWGVTAAHQLPLLRTAPGSPSAAAAGAAHAAGLSPSPRGGRSTALERLKAAQLLSPIPSRRQTDQQSASAASPPPPRRISEPGSGQGSSSRSRSGTPAGGRPAAANAALHNLKLRRQASVVASQLLLGSARPTTAPG